jgi:hypothetical protein
MKKIAELTPSESELALLQQAAGIENKTVEQFIADSSEFELVVIESLKDTGNIYPIRKD